MIERSLYRPILTVSVIVWYGFLALYTLISFFEGGLPQDIWQRLAGYTFSAVLSFAAGVLTFACIANFDRFRWVAVGAIALTTMLVHSAVGVAIYLQFPPYEYLQNAEFLPLFRAGMIFDSPIISSVFIGFIAIHLGRKLAEQQRLALAREKAAREAQLATLRHQLSPHFLFNTLNSISALISENENANAEKTVLMLSDFLRFTLDCDAGDLVTLEQELASLETYLAIERVRYEDRLSVRYDIEDAAKTVLVPPFLLQPVLENVIKHAVAKVPRPIAVTVSCQLTEEGLAIDVEDDGPGLSMTNALSSGVGLRNIKERLRLVYGPEARFSISDKPSGGVRVEMLLKTTPGKDA